MKAEIIEQVKIEMGYSDGNDCCSACSHYVGADLGGSMQAKGEHCTRNAFDIPVTSGGRCKHWASR